MAYHGTTFLSAELTAISHATEDVEKVEQAIRFLISTLFQTEVSPKRRFLKGHYGNPVTTISAKMLSKQLSPDLLARLSGTLSDSDKRFLSQEFKSCVDEEGNLYMRFDKQEAFLGNVKLHQSDPIRMKLKFDPSYDLNGINAACQQSGLIS
jgi:RNA binding exosome subunit